MENETKPEIKTIVTLEEIIEPEVVETSDKMMIFDYDISEIKNALEQYMTLEIDGYDDKEGYRKVDAAFKVTRKLKGKIEKVGKAARDPQTAHNRKISAREKDYTSLLVEAMDVLKGKMEVVDAEETRKYALEALPERKERLAKFGVELTDEEILRMDANFFESYYNNAKLKYFEEKERMMFDEKIQAFIKEHGYTEENTADYYVNNEGGVVTLYKKVAEINIAMTNNN